MKKLIRRSIFLLSLGARRMTFVSLLAQTGSIGPAKLPRLGTVGDAKIVTPVAVGTGARDAGGLWEPLEAQLEAQRVWRYTRSLRNRDRGDRVMNEPNASAMGGAPKGYDAVRYAKDFAVFRSFLKEQAPETMLLGPVR